MFEKARAKKIALANKCIALFPIATVWRGIQYYEDEIAIAVVIAVHCTINLELLTAIACTSIFSPLKKLKSEQKQVRKIYYGI